MGTDAALPPRLGRGRRVVLHRNAAHSSCSYSHLPDRHHLAQSTSPKNRVREATASDRGYSITNNPGNAGACVTGKLDPLSYSEGVWQLPPGQFPGNAATVAQFPQSLHRHRLGRQLGECPERHLDPVPPRRIHRHPVVRLFSSPPHGNRGCQRDGPGAGEPLAPPRANPGRRASRTGIWASAAVPTACAPAIRPGRAAAHRRRPQRASSSGLVWYPGLATVALSESNAGTFDVGKAFRRPLSRLSTGLVLIGTLPSLRRLQLARAQHGSRRLAEHTLASGPARPNELVPITRSQGIWQLSPGSFQSNF